MITILSTVVAMAVDPRDIENAMKVEKNYLSPLELKKKRGIWNEKDGKVEVIDIVLKAAKKANRSQKEENRIEILDIEGQFERCALARHRCPSSKLQKPKKILEFFPAFRVLSIGTAGD